MKTSALSRAMRFKCLLTTSLLLLVANFASAHCQVPCGIYGDELKFSELEQHVTTIAKASSQIRALTSSGALSAQEQQQVVRWVTNKESHAQKIIDEAANYFLAQRIKEGQDHYEARLELLHKIILGSMKCKQSADAAPAEELSKVLAEFKKVYFGEDHGHHHH